MELIINQINSLNRDETIDAALSVVAIIAGSASLEKSTDLMDNYLANMGEIEEFSRIILINAAEHSEEYRDTVSKIVAAAGKKNIVFTGAQVVELVGLGIIALHILLKKPVSEDIKYTDQTGKKMDIKRKWTNDNGVLATIMKKLLN